MNAPLDDSDPKQFGFPAGSPIFGFPTAVQREIIQASQRIRGATSFSLFWDRVLSQREREQLGGDMNACFARKYVAHYLVELCDWSLEQSIIEIAHKIGFLDSARHEWLLDEIGTTDRRSKSLPVWHNETGRLELDGELLRPIRKSIAKNLVKILDVFESSEWPDGIPNPIVSDNPQKIHEVVQSLNDTLKGLRFRAENDHIWWERHSGSIT